MRPFIIAVLVVFCMGLGSLGCHPKPRRPVPLVETYVDHFVTWPGENLSLIARWYTGRAQNWPEILEANPALDVRRLRKGTLVRIPQKLIIRSDPLPQSAISAGRGFEAEDAAPVQGSTPLPDVPTSVVEQPTETPAPMLQDGEATPAPTSEATIIQAEPVVEEQVVESTLDAATAQPTLEPTQEPTAAPTESQPAVTESNTATVPSKKSRDELLKELLDDY